LIFSLRFSALLGGSAVKRGEKIHHEGAENTEKS
jgi:hypothetical protein